jgi:hypothetical protein
MVLPCNGRTTGHKIQPVDERDERAMLKVLLEAVRNKSMIN